MLFLSLALDAGEPMAGSLIMTKEVQIQADTKIYRQPQDNSYHKVQLLLLKTNMLLNNMFLQVPCSFRVIHLHALQDRLPVPVLHGDEGGQHQILQFQPIFKFRNLNFR